MYKTQVIQNIPEDTENPYKSVNNCRKWLTTKEVHLREIENKTRHVYRETHLQQ